jgi:hypothetical protein
LPFNSSKVSLDKREQRWFKGFYLYSFCRGWLAQEVALAQKVKELGIEPNFPTLWQKMYKVIATNLYNRWYYGY